VAHYETEQEQLEAIKKWWKDNGSSIFIGILVGVGLLFGWRWYNSHTDQQGQLASNLYENMQNSVSTEDLENAENITAKLLTDHSDSPYAILAALNMARQDIIKKDLASAHIRLQWILDQDIKLEELKHIARLHKAKLFLSEQKVAEAKKLITNIDVGKFKASYAELTGDIAIIENETDKARIAYTEALEADSTRQLVQMKLDNLGNKVQIQAAIPNSITLPKTVDDYGNESTIKAAIPNSIPLPKTVDDYGNDSTN
jgi:predicted negative regulator of RcsB-dependent stress response